MTGSRDPFGRYCGMRANGTFYAMGPEYVGFCGEVCPHCLNRPVDELAYALQRLPDGALVYSCAVCADPDDNYANTDFVQARVAFTDGSSTGSIGDGGWAYVIGYGPDQGREAYGWERRTTNQRMELQAALSAVQDLPGPLVVVSDSAYVVNCFHQQWYVKWGGNGFKKISNVDLWEPLIYTFLERDDVAFTHMRGHGRGDDHPTAVHWNGVADARSRQARVERVAQAFVLSAAS